MEIFESHAISSALSWVGVAAILTSCALAPFASVEDSYGLRSHRILYFWLLLCLVVLSPLRYIIFQMCLAESFLVQSWGAFLTSLVALFYLPIVYGMLYVITLGIPALGTAVIAGGEISKRWRVAVAALLAPALCLASWIPFGLLLPIAAWTVQWLDPVALVRATNGPNFYVFKYIAAPFSPIRVQFPSQELSERNLTDRDAVRLHVASVYMSSENLQWFIQEAYPGLNSVSDDGMRQ